jgi:hypothetical protein
MNDLSALAPALLAQSAVILGVAVFVCAFARHPHLRVALLRYALVATIGVALLSRSVPRPSIPGVSAEAKPFALPATEIPVVDPIRSQEFTGIKSFQPVVDKPLAALRPPKPIQPPFDPKPLLLAVWGVGSVLLLGRVALGTLWLRALLRTSKASSHTGAIRVEESTLISTPIVAGFWQPTVFLPESQEFSEQEVQTMLDHEFAHVRGKDSAWALAYQIFVAALWPNPFVWIAARQMNAACEEICDLAVIDQGAKPKDYAESLLRIAERSSRQVGGAAVGMFSSQTQLAKRIRLMLDPNRVRPTNLASRGRFQLAFGAGAIALAACFIIPAPAETIAVVAVRHGRSSSRSIGSFPVSRAELKLAAASRLPYIKGDFTLAYHLFVEDPRSDQQRLTDLEQDKANARASLDRFVAQGKITAQLEQDDLNRMTLPPRPAGQELDITLSSRNGLVLYKDSKNMTILLTRNQAYGAWPTQGFAGSLFSAVNAYYMPIPAAGFAHFPLSMTPVLGKNPEAEVSDLPSFNAMGVRRPFDGNLVTDLARFPGIAKFDSQGRLVALLNKEGSPEYVYRDFIRLRGVQVASNYTRTYNHLQFRYELVSGSESGLPPAEFDPALLFSGKFVQDSYKGRQVNFTADRAGTDLETQMKNETLREDRQAQFVAQLEAHLATIPNGGPDIMPVYRQALARAMREGKRVLAISTATTCPPCHQLARMLQDPAVKSIVGSRFEVLWIDAGEGTDLGKKSENKNGDALCKQLGIWTGFPSYASVDQSGKVVQVSGTLGFPGNSKDDERFFKVFDAGRAPLTAEERRKMQAYLDSHRM